MSKKMPKVLAIYLPQFHETRDNNNWWGKGFTDWVSVKTAESYFQGHNEPRVPLDENYYDLSKKDTMRQQAALAKEYGIDGFCFYHYYFQKGKMELELPAENLLKWKDIDMPFCFNWASESWIRSWSRIAGNVWAEKYESSNETDHSGILALQDYGTEKDWEKHFEYLLPFFLDDRYIRIDGKPVFLFYSPNDISCLHEMVSCWRQLADRNGLNGLYLIGANINAANKDLDASIIYEPRNAINRLNSKGKVCLKNGVRCFDYGEAWDEIIDTFPVYGYKTYFCGISGYDDTPRRGKSGECLLGNWPHVFQDGLTKLITKSMSYDNQLVFINAWNEWGEGMYLEPDEIHKYEFLEAIAHAKEEAVMNTENLRANDVDKSVMQEMTKLDYNARKFKKLFEIMDKWLFAEQINEAAFKKYFINEDIQSIAIYGMAALGKHLFIQLKKEGMNPAFGIDRYVGQFGDDFKVYRPEEDFPYVDAIVITAYDVESVRKMLSSKYGGKILSIEEILDKFI